MPSIGLIVPANSQFPDAMFMTLCSWLGLSGIDPAQIDGSKPIFIGGGMITASTLTGALQGPIQVGMPVELYNWMSAHGMETDNLVHPSVMDLVTPEGPVTLDLSDMSSLVEQLRAGREKEREGKAEAEEARDQILARLRTESADIGTVGGAPAVRWKVITKKQFETTRFRAAHPDLAAEFTGERQENRLELL